MKNIFSGNSFLLKIVLSAVLSGSILYLSGGEVRKLAAKGDSAAQFQLGCDYFYGSDQRPQNPDLAAYWFRKAADAGLPAAQFNYGICLEQGYGIKKDLSLAADFYRKAYSSGNLNAGFNLAMLLLHDLKQKAEAVQILEQLKDQEIAAAMVELAAVYFNEKDVTTPQRQQGFRLLEHASTLPDVPAKGYRLLADCYYGGIGTEQNPALAESCLEKAVSMNDPSAMVKLAFICEQKGRRDRAFRLYRQAAEAGLAFGEYKYAEYICDGMEKGKGLNAALELYERSAEKGCPQAFQRLALFAMTGVGLDKPDKPRAAILFEKAAKIGHAPAQYNLAAMYAAGDGIPQDDKRAFFWFGQAAIRGHAISMRRLGECFYRGIGCLKDNEKAAEWIRAAAEAGDVPAQLMLRQGTQSAW